VIYKLSLIAESFCYFMVFLCVENQTLNNLLFWTGFGMELWELGEDLVQWIPKEFVVFREL
jgi:hypothetical protein